MPSIVVITGDDRIDNAITALHHRAADFLLKPFSFDALDASLTRARHKRMPPADGNALSRHARLCQPRYGVRDTRLSLLGDHPSLLRVFSIIERVCDTDCSVLVTGESGTGKELVARAIHDASDRSDHPFVTVNCAAIPDNLAGERAFWPRQRLRLLVPLNLG